MIIYIASYPRSGNTWCRNLLFENFGLVSSSLYSGEFEASYYMEEENILENWHDWVHHHAQLLTMLPGMSDAELIARLDREQEFKRIWARSVELDEGQTSQQATCLHKGCLPMLTIPDLRRYLSLKSELYIIKTHHLPFDHYFAGEKVIQVVRHPGPVLRSYATYLDKRGKTFTHRQLILGWLKFGDWSKYHRAWQQTAAELGGNRFLQIRFETMKADILAVLQQLQTFLQVPLIEKEVRSFSAYQVKNPDFYAYGSSTDWQTAFTRLERMLFALRHGRMMVEMGYEKSWLHAFQYVFK